MLKRIFLLIFIFAGFSNAVFSGEGINQSDAKWSVETKVAMENSNSNEGQPLKVLHPEGVYPVEGDLKRTGENSKQPAVSITGSNNIYIKMAKEYALPVLCTLGIVFVLKNVDFKTLLASIVK